MIGVNVWIVRSLIAVVCALALPLPSAAAAPLVFLPANTGDRVHYRLVHNAQGSPPATVAFDLVRKTGATVVLVRSQPNGAPNLSLLKLNPDGSLALAEDPRAAAVDGDLNDLLAGLNMAVAATHDADAVPRGTWYANLTLAQQPAVSAAVVLVPGPVTGMDYDFAGSGTATTTAIVHDQSGGPGGADDSSDGPPRGGGGGPGGGSRGGISGGLGGLGGLGGMAGGAHRRRGGDDPSAAGRNADMAIDVHVEGHASAGRVNRLAITETRSITVAGLPFVNANTWQLSVSK